MRLPFFLLVPVCAVIASETICHGDVCYPKVFVPTEDFQVVQDDQDIPAGLHVKLNVATGLKEAKLYHEEPEKKVNDLVIVDDVKPYRPSNTLSKADTSAFNQAIEALKHSCDTTVLDALATLEDLVHELEFGIHMAEKIEPLLHLLQSEDERCRANAALVLGSSLRNNANAIKVLPDFPLTSQLITLLNTEGDDQACRMLVYALSASMGRDHARSEYMQIDGHETLIGKYENKGTSNELRGKIASFVEDHFAQHFKYATMRIQGQETGVNLPDDVAVELWCAVFQDSLVAKVPASIREKILSSLIAIKDANKEQCISSASFDHYLADEAVGKHKGHQELRSLARTARAAFGNTKSSRKHGASEL